jgi:UDP-3-O-[3-hydroxymyristoyl] glucosamine N-acyltransferase
VVARVSKTIAQIAQHISGEVKGDEHLVITGVGTIEKANSTELAFLANSKYKKYLSETTAGCVIVGSDVADDVRGNAIVVNDPYVGYAKAASFLFPNHSSDATIHPSSVIDETATIHNTATVEANTVIQAHAVIGAYAHVSAGTVVGQRVQVGAHTHLRANVTLCEDVQIGERCLIHPGVVIGADGFGIANDNGKWIKVPQLGAVVIGDDVEIGANTTIDRGAIDNTLIGNGVKLDNQIQIGHNVIIGDHTVIAGCVGIAGSTKIGQYCAIGGGAGIGGHLEITDGVQLTGMTMVTKSITQSGVYSSGIPAEPTRDWHRNVVRYRQMEKLTERVTKIEKTLEK